MLGHSLSDPDGVDGERHATLPGLGLLPLATHYGEAKRVVPTTGAFARTQGPWAPLSGIVTSGYEIRHGITRLLAAQETATAVLHDGAGAPIGWQAGPVLGVYTHGLFESATVLQAMFGNTAPTLDSSFETLADMLEEHLDAALLRRLITGERS